MNSPSPTVADFQSALSTLHPLADHHDRILGAHYSAPDGTMTASQIADAVGYADYHGVNLHYGKLAALICEKLGRSHDFGILLASAAPDADDGQLALVLRPELVEAIDNLGWYKRA